MLIAFAVTLAAAQDPLPAQPIPVSETPAASTSRLWWGDFDADALPDLLAVGADGRALLLRNRGDGSFDDVTAGSGLAALAAPTLASWIDVDGDGALDLVTASLGSARTFLGVGDGVFAEGAELAGLETSAVLGMAWVDFDANELPDLQLATSRGDRLYQNVGEGRFASAELPALLVPWEVFGSEPAERTASEAGSLRAGSPEGSRTTRDVARRGERAPLDAPNADDRGGSDDGRYGPGAGGFPLGGGPKAGLSCADSVIDTATSNCTLVSSVPTFGTIYPLGPEFNINPAGQVLIGTVTPDPNRLVRIDGSGFNTALRVDGDTVGVMAEGSVAVSGNSTNVSNSGTGVRGTGFYGVRAEAFDGFGGGTALVAGGGEYGVDASGSLVGVFAEASDPGSFGVGGQATGGDAGVVGVGGAVAAVWGLASPVGVRGEGTTGVEAAGVDVGVSGTASDPLGVGVFGDGDGGVQGQGGSYGVIGFLTGASGAGSVGTATGATAGVAGDANGTPGSFTLITNSGTSGVNHGVGGVGTIGASLSTDGVGVAGRAGTAGGAGVAGSATATFVTYIDDSGVSGVNDSPTGFGVAGVNTAATGTAIGVYGSTSSSTGVGVYGIASTTTSTGVVGVNTAGPGGLAVLASGDFGATGTKSFIQPHPTDASKEIRFVCLEGNESGTYFRGSAALAGGSATIEVPEEFRLVTDSEGLTVQVTALGPGSLWVAEKGLERIVVRGTEDVEFDYFVNGVRRGFEEFEPVRENVSFVPEELGVAYGAQYPEGLRRILVENGILNADYTPNAATAASRGWTLRSADEAPRVHVTDSEVRARSAELLEPPKAESEIDLERLRSRPRPDPEPVEIERRAPERAEVQPRELPDWLKRRMNGSAEPGSSEREETGERPTARGERR